MNLAEKIDKLRTCGSEKNPFAFANDPQIHYYKWKFRSNHFQTSPESETICCKTEYCPYLVYKPVALLLQWIEEINSVKKYVLQKSVILQGKAKRLPLNDYVIYLQENNFPHPYSFSPTYHN